MEFYKNTKVITCLGDEVRYDFMQMLTKFPLKDFLAFKTKDIIMVHGKQDKLLEEVDRIIIYSSELPLGRVLQVPKWNFNTKSFVSDEKKAEKVLIFNSFPYPKQNILDQLETMASEIGTTDIEIVLYKEVRRFAASDMDSENDSIDFAMKTYLEFTRQVTIYNEGDNPLPLLSVVPKFVWGMSNTYQRDLTRVQYSIQRRFHTRYIEEIQNEVDFYFDILNPEEFEKLLKTFEFQYVKGSKDIWEQYCENFKNIYLYGEYQLMSILVDFYLDYLVDIYGWDIGQEKKYIEDRLLKCFNKALKYPKKLPLHKNLPIPKTEMEYKQLLVRVPLNVEFQRLIKIFFYEKAKDEILYSLQDKINSITRRIVV